MGTPRRPEPTLGLGSSAGLGRYSDSNGGLTYSPRLMRIEPFEQDIRSHATTRPPRRADLEKRPSLCEVPFETTIPTAPLLAMPLPSSNALNVNSHVGTMRSNSSPSVAPPNEFLASLRSKTLLDYDFMRAFSLAKRKPLSERNLSRMSASSVYSMRMAQMDLDQQAQRLQRLPIASTASTATAKAEDEIRSPEGAAVVNAGGPSRPQFRRLHAVQAPMARSGAVDDDHDAGTTCFPTLWRPQEDAAAAAASPVDRKAILTLKYRQPKPEAPSPPVATHSSGVDAPSSRSRRRLDHKLKAEPPTAPLISEGLSDFDLRKCHSTAIVTAQHGYLQDQDLAKLLAETGYDRAELYALWARFKALCAIAKSPKGIDKDTFRRGIPQLSVEDQFFIDRVFDILDADGSGILEWQEFVEALSALEKGDIAQRVGFLFRVYDLNGDGSSIHRNEVRQFFLTSLLIDTTDELVDVAKHFVGKIFDAVGCGDQDTMKIEDALRYMREHPSADIYSLFGRTMVTKQRPNTDLNVAQWSPEPPSGLPSQQKSKPPKPKADRFD